VLFLLSALCCDSHSGKVYSRSSFGTARRDAMYTNHPGGTASAMVVGGKKRIHTTFSDGCEMVEEYDMTTDELVSKRWKEQNAIGKDKGWVFEIGEPPQTTVSNEKDGLLLSSASSNPIFLNRDHVDTWEWRVRNLPYPKNVYSVSVDDEKQELVLRTSNRKYYKRWKIPSLHRYSIQLESQRVSFEHSNNTLVIQYDKPDIILEEEGKARKERRKAESDKATKSKDGDVDCKQQ